MARPQLQVNSAEIDSSKRPRAYIVKDQGGQDVELQSSDEKRYYNQAVKRYLHDNAFTVGSDLRALDRLVFFETLVFRYTCALGSGYNSAGLLLHPSEEIAMRRSLKDSQAAISVLQTELGLTRAQRELDNADSLPAYLSELRVRAKEHGVHRVKQLDKALELMNSLMALAGAYRRSSPEEREKLGFTNAEEIVDYILDVAKPQYDEIDEHYKHNQQRYWVGKV